MQHRKSNRIAAWSRLCVFALIIFNMHTATATTTTVAVADTRELVVVLHGLNVTSLTMRRIERALERGGYRVVNRSYPSRTMPAEKIATQWLPQLLAASNAAAAPRVHFVAHSLGGIIVRLWLRDCATPANMGRVVMLAPPNHGSEIPDHFRAGALRRPFFRLITGVNGPRLGAAATPDSLTRPLGAFPANVELGIIAGNRWMNPLFLRWFAGENDGTVSVASTQLAGMRDHIVMPYSHTGILMRDAAVAQIIAFLRDGKFNRAEQRENAK